MTRDFFDPTPEQNVVLLNAATLQAQRMIAGQRSLSKTAEIPIRADSRPSDGFGSERHGLRLGSVSEMLAVWGDNYGEDTH